MNRFPYSISVKVEKVSSFAPAKLDHFGTNIAGTSLIDPIRRGANIYTRFYEFCVCSSMSG